MDMLNQKVAHWHAGDNAEFPLKEVSLDDNLLDPTLLAFVDNALRCLASPPTTTPLKRDFAPSATLSLGPARVSFFRSASNSAFAEDSVISRLDGEALERCERYAVSEGDAQSMQDLTRHDLDEMRQRLQDDWKILSRRSQGGAPQVLAARPQQQAREGY